MELYFRYPTDVLISVFLREPQVFIQPESHVVAIKAVGR